MQDFLLDVYYVSAFTDRNFDYIKIDRLTKNLSNSKFVSFFCASYQSTPQLLKKEKRYETNHK